MILMAFLSFANFKQNKKIIVFDNLAYIQNLLSSNMQNRKLISTDSGMDSSNLNMFESDSIGGNKHFFFFNLSIKSRMKKLHRICKRNRRIWLKGLCISRQEAQKREICSKSKNCQKAIRCWTNKKCGYYRMCKKHKRCKKQLKCYKKKRYWFKNKCWKPKKCYEHKSCWYYHTSSFKFYTKDLKFRGERRRWLQTKDNKSLKI